MEKLKHSAAKILSRISFGFSHGLGQMVTLGQGVHVASKRTTSADALRNDWERVGHDMSNAISSTRKDRLGKPARSRGTHAA